MAIGRTLSTCGRQGKIYRNLPGAEGGEFANVAPLRTHMNLVAGNTSPTLFAVDVKEVKVPVSIAKIGQVCRAFVQNHGFLVAFETKGVHLEIKGIVKFLIKIVLQILGHISRVGFVAGAANLLLDRTVLIKSIFRLLLHFFVAAETKGHIFGPSFQKFVVIGGMGSVATSASALGHRFVNYRGTGNLFHHFFRFLLVAVDTQGKFVFIEEELGRLGAVRVMTADASFIFNDLVQILGLADQELLVFVASPA